MYYTKILLLLLKRLTFHCCVYKDTYNIKSNLTTLILFYLYNNFLTVKGILSMLFQYIVYRSWGYSRKIGWGGGGVQPTLQNPYAIYDQTQ